MDKSTFQYLMDFYHLDRIPIFYRNDFVGYVSRDLKYTHENTLSYMRSDSYAIDLAYDQINSVIALIKELNQETEVEIVHFWETWGDGWDSIKKTEVSKSKGTLDSIFEIFEKANNRLRYCNGSGYEFSDDAIAKKYRVWTRLISESRSFRLYYGNGTVD